VLPLGIRFCGFKAGGAISCDQRLNMVGRKQTLEALNENRIGVQYMLDNQGRRFGYKM
jgi:hypothetical protein